MSNNRVIVTGGSGFIGTNIVAYFLGIGWDVINFDLTEPRNKDQFPFWEKVDLLDRFQLIKKTQDIKPSIFLHFGGRTDLDETKNISGYSANIEGVYNVLDAIQSTSSIQRVVFASSQMVCRLGYIPQDDHDYRPNTLYGQSKVLTELIIRNAGDVDTIWTIVRPTSIWGPWFDIPYKKLFRAIGRNLYFHAGEVSSLKQWGFVGNTVYQIWEIIHTPEQYVHRKTLYLADYSPVCLHEFANKVQNRMGAKPIRKLPVIVLKNVARLGDAAQFIGWKNPPLTSFRFQNIVTSELQDLTELEGIVGPLPYTLEQGIDITVSWLEGH
jgi:nucleoside-diphosphate-sugar epimerase